MFVYSSATGVLVCTPAKINLFLEILARRADGFHELETLMAAVSLYDTLELAPTNDGEIRLSCRWAGGIQARQGDRAAGTEAGPAAAEELPLGEKNIVYRAVDRLRGRSGAVTRGASVRLTKRIPSAAGLGGASSDAAAALVAASVAWGLNWPTSRLAEVAAELGSDVPFFLQGGWAICRGRGERIEPDRGGRLHVVVVRPREGLATSAVYARCQPAQAPASVTPLRKGLSTGDWRAIRHGLFNRLTAAASSLNPLISELSEKLHQVGSIAGQMSGSGSSCFGICRSARHARRIAARLRSLQLGETFSATIAGRGRQPASRGGGDIASAN